MDERAQLKIIRNMPKRSIGLLHEVMDQMGSTQQSEIDRAQEKIYRILSNLDI
jgi:flagellar motor switch protein FliG